MITKQFFSQNSDFYKPYLFDGTVKVSMLH